MGAQTRARGERRASGRCQPGTFRRSAPHCALRFASVSTVSTVSTVSFDCFIRLFLRPSLCSALRFRLAGFIRLSSRRARPTAPSPRRRTWWGCRRTPHSRWVTPIARPLATSTAREKGMTTGAWRAASRARERCVRGRRSVDAGARRWPKELRLEESTRRAHSARKWGPAVLARAGGIAQS